MSSTLTVGTLFSVASTVPSNAPSSSFIVLLTSVTELSISPSNVPVTNSVFSAQSLPFSASRITMTSATMTISTTPTSESPSVSSPSVPQTSATVLSVSSSDPSSKSDASSSASSSSTPGSPDASTTPLTTTETTTPGLTSSSSTTFQVDTTTSTPTPAISSTLDMSLSTTPLSASSDLSSQGSSPEITNMPLTTVLQSTTIVITSTNSQGQVVTSAPPVVTEVITTTGNGGVATTVTQAVVNPTLAPDNSTSEASTFFADTGAVVGVFVVVGLACAAILMWIVFAIRHRQRMARMEQDTAVEAAVAAAGLHRTPLDDDDGGDSPILSSTRRQFHPFPTRMGQRSFWGLGGSSPSPHPTRHSGVLGDHARDSANSHPGLPAEHHASSLREGYVPARTTSPSSLNRAEQGTYDLSSSRERKSSYGHTPTYSAGSFEPLLANYAQNMSDQDTSTDIVEVPRSSSPKRTGTSSAPDGFSLDKNPEDVSRATFQRRSSSSSYRDEDYTRYVLMVRNLPDNQTQHSS